MLSYHKNSYDLVSEISKKMKAEHIPVWFQPADMYSIHER